MREECDARGNTGDPAEKEIQRNFPRPGRRLKHRQSVVTFSSVTRVRFTESWNCRGIICVRRGDFANFVKPLLGCFGFWRRTHLDEIIKPRQLIEWQTLRKQSQSKLPRKSARMSKRSSSERWALPAQAANCTLQDFPKLQTSHERHRRSSPADRKRVRPHIRACTIPARDLCRAASVHPNRRIGWIASGKLSHTREQVRPSAGHNKMCI